MRDLILRVAKRRFGGAPRKMKRRIAKISSYVKLSRLAEQVQQVDSLDELDLD